MIIEIKDRWNGRIIFSIEAENIKEALNQAVRSGANLSRADLYGANLSGADLSGADLSGANLSRANLYGANLYRADLSGANLSGASLSGADLSGASLSGADLSGASLSGADLSGASLSGADLSEADLYGANLSRADLSRAGLSGANLSGASLSGADLSGASLSGADLYGANLSRADLSRAGLSGANLSRADLSRADLYGAIGVNYFLLTPLAILLEQPEKIRAYKLVNQNYQGPYHGGITYEIGKTYRCKADSNKQVQCSYGISLASLNWCIKEFQDSYHILIAEFTAKDIAAIPIATDGKFRVSKCKIVGEKDLGELGLLKEEVEDSNA